MTKDEYRKGAIAVDVYHWSLDLPSFPGAGSCAFVGLHVRCDAGDP